MKENKNYYQILEIDKNDTEEQIKKAYHRLSLQWHPDKNNSLEATEKFQEINEAYEVLGNEELRKEYDLRETNTLPIIRLQTKYTELTEKINSNETIKEIKNDEQLKNLANIINDYEERDKTIAEISAILFSQNFEAEQKIRAIYGEIENLTREKEEIIGQQWNERQNLKDKVEQLENDNSELLRKNEQLKNSENEYFKNLTKYEEQIEKLFTENEKLEKRIKQLATENEKLTARSKTNEEVTKTLDDKNEKEVRLKQELEAIKKEARESQQELEQLKEQQLEAWTGYLNDRENERNDWNNKEKEYQKTNRQITTENQQLKTHLETVSKENERVNQEKNYWENQFRTIEEQKNELQWEIESSWDELRESKEKIKNLENKLRKTEKKPTNFSEERKKAEQEKLIKELRKENSELHSNLKTTSELLEKYQIDYEELETSLVEEEKKVKGKLAVKNKRLRKLKNDNYEQNKIIAFLQETKNEKNDNTKKTKTLQNNKQKELKKPVKQTSGWKSRLFQTAKYIGLSGLSFYGGKNYQNSPNSTSIINNQPVITSFNAHTLPFTPALNLIPTDTSPVSPLQSFYDQVIVNKNQATQDLNLHGSSFDNFYEDITNKKNEIRTLKRENKTKDSLIVKITQERNARANIRPQDLQNLRKNLRDNEKALQNRGEISREELTAFRNELISINSALTTNKQSLQEWTKEFPEQTPLQVQQSITDIKRQLADEQTNQKRIKSNLNSQITNLTTKLKQNTKQKNSFRRQIQFREEKISNLINQKRELNNQLNIHQQQISQAENFGLTDWENLPNQTQNETLTTLLARPTRKELEDKQTELTQTNQQVTSLTTQLDKFNTDLLSFKENSRFEIARLKSESKNYQKQRDSRPDITVKEYQELVVENNLLNNRPNITSEEFASYSSPQQVAQKIKSAQKKEANKYRHHKSPLEVAQLKQNSQNQKEYELINSGWKNPEEVTKIKNATVAREQKLEKNMADLIQQINRSIAANNSTKATNDRLTQNREDLCQTIKQLVTKQENQETTINNLKNENRQLTQDLATEQEKTKQLRNDFTSAKSQSPKTQSEPTNNNTLLKAVISSLISGFYGYSKGKKKTEQITKKGLENFDSELDKLITKNQKTIRDERQKKQTIQVAYDTLKIDSDEHKHNDEKLAEAFHIIRQNLKVTLNHIFTLKKQNKQLTQERNTYKNQWDNHTCSCPLSHETCSHSDYEELKTERDELQTWKDNHDCSPSPACSLPLHSDYDQIKQEKDELKKQLDNYPDYQQIKTELATVKNNLCSDGYHQAIEQQKEQDIITLFNNRLKLNLLEPDLEKLLTVLIKLIKKPPVEIEKKIIEQLVGTPIHTQDLREIKKLNLHSLTKNLKINCSQQMEQQIKKAGNYQTIIQVKERLVKAKLTEQQQDNRTIQNQIKNWQIIWLISFLSATLIIVSLLIKIKIIGRPKKGR